MTQIEERSSGRSAHFGDPAVELSARRTGMSFQRTRMSAERTLMSVIRTSLSLIGFGFTIFQFFDHLRESKLIAGSGHAARSFGLSLVLLGVAMLVVGIWYHFEYMQGLRHERERLKREHLIHGESGYPVSMTLIIAVVLLAIGLLAILSMTFRTGPFG